jgi:fructose-1,6-bisphosphatase II
MDRDLSINLVRVTEAAALSASKYLGRGDKNAADGAAVDAMRNMFDTISIDGEVVIGEGEMDEAPMLYIGEKIGSVGVGPMVDIAVDPIDGTTALAKGLSNSIAVVALAPKGMLLKAPDMYMDKIAVGPKGAKVVSLNKSVEENLISLANALNKDVSELTVSVIDRERSIPIIMAARKLGSRVNLFKDGDVATAIATCFEDSGIDIFISRGGAPEGVIAAAAIRALGGYMEARLYPENEDDIERCQKMGADYTRVLTLDDLVGSDDIFFAATGITNGDMLKGVRFKDKYTAITHSLIIRGKTGTIRFIEAIHQLDKKTI